MVQFPYVGKKEMNVFQKKEGGSIQVMTCTGRGVIRRQRGQPIARRRKGGSGKERQEVVMKGDKCLRFGATGRGE